MLHFQTYIRYWGSAALYFFPQ